MAYKNYRKKGRKAPLSRRQAAMVKKIADKEIHKVAMIKEFVDETDASIPNITVTTVDTPVVIYDREYDHNPLSLAINATIDCNTDTSQQMRIIVFEWEEGNVSPQLQDILHTDTAHFALNSFYRRGADNKYKILSDSTHLWDANSTNAPQLYRFKMGKDSFSKKGPRRTFDAYNPDSAGINMHRVYLTAITDGVDGQIRNINVRTCYDTANHEIV